METVYYSEDVIPLVFRLGLSFRKETDEPEVVFNRNKNLIMDLIKSKRFEFAESENQEAEYDWSDKVAKKYIATLSPHQSLVLKTIKKNNNEASFDLLKLAIKDAKLAFTNNRTFAGIFSGLTRKCQSWSLPFIYSCKLKDDNTYIYSISDKAYPFISKYL